MTHPGQADALVQHPLWAPERASTVLVDNIVDRLGWKSEIDQRPLHPRQGLEAFAWPTDVESVDGQCRCRRPCCRNTPAQRPVQAALISSGASHFSMATTQILAQDKQVEGELLYDHVMRILGTMDPEVHRGSICRGN